GTTERAARSSSPATEDSIESAGCSMRATASAAPPRSISGPRKRSRKSRSAPSRLNSAPHVGSSTRLAFGCGSHCHYIDSPRLRLRLALPLAAGGVVDARAGEGLALELVGELERLPTRRRGRGLRLRRSGAAGQEHPAGLV